MNRLLDDNRELLIPETQETVKPHRNFLLFATQNPPGVYGGRKVLSRAFRNRFLELHFNDLPETELQGKNTKKEIIIKGILYQRCKIAPSYAKKIVDVYLHLRIARQQSRIFDGKNGFITLRDLFRWANRHADSYQRLAEDGYMILGERTRTPHDTLTVKNTLEEIMRVVIVPDEMYHQRFLEIHVAWHVTVENAFLVWTRAMKRLYALIATCIINDEPVLLVGETGCGKTSVCQLIAYQLRRHLHIVNVHQNSETADFLGSQRPTRSCSIDDEGMHDIFLELRSILDESDMEYSVDHASDMEYSVESVAALCASLQNTKLNPSQSVKLQTLQRIATPTKQLFEWADGPLVKAMKHGDLFLLDEISLADDSVLERLNSVLEPQRLLVLAEKLEETGGSVQEITAHPAFQFMATMNPGGDYGKKELSPALRNRFTEIWVPQIDDRADIIDIMNSTLLPPLRAWHTAEKIYDYFWWISEYLQTPYAKLFSVRDLLAWANFMNVTQMCVEEAFYHAGSMVVIDGIGANPLLASCTATPAEMRVAFDTKLRQITGLPAFDVAHHTFSTNGQECGVAGFTIKQGASIKESTDSFTLQAPTTLLNAVRVFRALQITKPILLEGSPGVGKTSLITRLASLSGNTLVRINLSEQTDLMDLFGSDLPVESNLSDITSGLVNGLASDTTSGSASDSASRPQFAWRDGPFLQAMTRGSWVLLDELNLASQQVLEGLNACLDHRGSVYIPELDRTFTKSPDFRIFAAQNPQGGGRKGLPKSFLNRFSKVYINAMTESDLIMISTSLHPHINTTTITQMVHFTTQLHHRVSLNRAFATTGSPWEFNIRDCTRWITLLDRYPHTRPADHVELIFSLRMRTDADRMKLRELYGEIFNEDTMTDSPSCVIHTETIRIGKVTLPRMNSNADSHKELSYLVGKGVYFEAVAACVDMNWLTLLYGPTASGKTSMIRYLAAMTGNKLQEFSMNEGVDTLEILGGFEQIDVQRKIELVKKVLSEFLLETVQCGLLGTATSLTIDTITHLTDVVKSLTIASLPECLHLLQLLEPKITSGLEIITSAITRIQTLIHESSHRTQGQFEWIDSSLIQALQHGHWILLDHANLCSPSVLDRLNSLFEPSGSIILNERGIINNRIIEHTPHKNFRMFMTMDPTRGEISRAMRNRGIEIYMLDTVVENFAVKESVEECYVMADKVKKDGVLFEEGGVIMVDSLQRGTPLKLDCIPPSLDVCITPSLDVCSSAYALVTSSIEKSYSHLHLPVKHFEYLMASLKPDYAAICEILAVESTLTDDRLIVAGLRSILSHHDSTDMQYYIENLLKYRTLDLCEYSTEIRALAFRLVVTGSYVQRLQFNTEDNSIMKTSTEFIQGRVFDSQLSHPAIKFIQPFFESLHEFNQHAVTNNTHNEHMIKCEEQLVHTASSDTIDIFSLWMILEDVSKSQDYMSLANTHVVDLRAALDIENTMLFKNAWKMWRPAVVKNQAEFDVACEIDALTRMFTLDFTSMTGTIFILLLFNERSSCVD